MTWYKTGTVSVVQSSTSVTGNGTDFIANSRVGDAFRGPDGAWYEVTNIASALAISISPAYQGITQAAGVFACAPMQGYVKDSADALNAFVRQFGTTLSGLGTTGNYDVLPVSKGGTASTDAASARSALGMGTVAVENVLPVEKGGTGAIDAASARSALGMGVVAVENVLPVGKGGTGATDPAAARDSLGLTLTASTTDTSLGRVMRVGDFGVGVVMPTSLDANLLTKPGHYYTSGGVNTPEVYGVLEVFSGDSAYVSQRFTTVIGRRVWYRQMVNNVWDVWQLLWTRNNILGPVAQVSGVPTGALVESGSNANGFYTKWADGTLICWAIVSSDSVPLSGFIGKTYALPVTFAGANYAVSAVGQPTLNYDWYGVVGAVPTGTNTIQLTVRNGAGAAQSFALRYVCIGRWF